MKKLGEVPKICFLEQTELDNFCDIIKQQLPYPPKNENSFPEENRNSLPKENRNHRQQIQEKFNNIGYCNPHRLFRCKDWDCLDIDDDIFSRDCHFFHITTSGDHTYVLSTQIDHITNYPYSGFLYLYGLVIPLE